MKSRLTVTNSCINLTKLLIIKLIELFQLELYDELQFEYLAQP